MAKRNIKNSKRVPSLKPDKIFDKDKKELALRVQEKLVRAGRNPDGSFAKGNTLWNHGKEFWNMAELNGRERHFKTPQLLLEAFKEYCTYVQNRPWMRKEVVKGGDLAGMVIDVPTQTPYTYQGFCGFVGLTTAWYRKARLEYKKRLDEDEKDEDSRSFVTAIQIIDDAIYSQKFDGAAIGVFNATLITRDLGLADKTELLVDDRERVANAFPFEDDQKRINARENQS